MCTVGVLPVMRVICVVRVNTMMRVVKREWRGARIVVLVRAIKRN